MEGTAKRQVNAEEMLAELKLALESSTPAPDVAPPFASMAAKSGSLGREPRRSQMDKESDRPATVNAGKTIRQRTDNQKPSRLSSRRGKLTAGGLALGGAAAFFAGVALMSQVLNRPAHEFSAGATEGLIRPQNEQTLEPSSSARAPMEGSQQTAPSQAGASEARPDASRAPANNGSVSAQGKAQVDAANLASSGLEMAAPAPARLNSAAVWAPAVRIGPDGAPIPTAPPSRASADSAHPAETPKPAAAPAGPQMLKPGAAPIATAPPTPASTDSALVAKTPKPAVPTAAPQMVKPDKAPIATAPPTPASTDSALVAQTPKPAVPTAAPQIVKPDAAPIATAPPTPASTEAGPVVQTSKPNATRTASVSNESAEPSTPKIDSKKKPPEKPSAPKPAKSAKAPAKSVAQAERQSAKPAQPKEAERSPEPAQGAGNPTQATPVAAPSVPQRVADGVTHAFGYLVHLPGALVPHFGGSNPNAQ